MVMFMKMYFYVFYNGYFFEIEKCFCDFDDLFIVFCVLVYFYLIFENFMGIVVISL